MKISISKSLLKTFTENKLLFFIENIFHQKEFFFQRKQVMVNLTILDVSVI